MISVSKDQMESVSNWIQPAKLPLICDGLEYILERFKAVEGNIIFHHDPDNVCPVNFDMYLNSKYPRFHNNHMIIRLSIDGKHMFLIYENHSNTFAELLNSIVIFPDGYVMYRDYTTFKDQPEVSTIKVYLEHSGYTNFWDAIVYTLCLDPNINKIMSEEVGNKWRK